METGRKRWRQSVTKVYRQGKKDWRQNKRERGQTETEGKRREQKETDRVIRRQMERERGQTGTKGLFQEIIVGPL